MTESVRFSSVSLYAASVFTMVKNSIKEPNTHA